MLCFVTEGLSVAWDRFSKSIDWDKWMSVCKEYRYQNFTFTYSKAVYELCGVELPFDSQ